MKGDMKKCTQNFMPKKSMFFKEEILSDVICIPNQKPDMERILDLVAWLEVEEYNLIDTELGYSHEGQILTGKKLIIEIRIKEKLTYVADEPRQSAHAAHYEKIKSAFVILPEKYNDKYICDLVRAGRLIITPFVEDVCYRQINKRELHRSLMIFVDVSLC